MKTELFTTRTDWLRGTHYSIGASSAAKIVRLSGYGSPFSEWYRLTEPCQINEPDELQRWGLLLEPVILSEFVRQSGVRAEQLPPITVHRGGEYIHATLDAQADDGSPVELKTAHFAAAKVWKNEVPISYLCQVQMQIHCTDAKCGYIAVLKDGYEFAWHKVERHQKFIDRLRRRLDQFWNNHVLTREPPPTDFSQATADALANKYPTATDTAIALPDELQPLVQEYDELTAAESAATKRKDEIKNLIKSKMGENRYGSFGSKDGFQWNGSDGKRTFRRAKRCPEPVVSQ